jgi:hypothetical protein
MRPPLGHVTFIGLYRPGCAKPQNQNQNQNLKPPWLGRKPKGKTKSKTQTKSKGKNKPSNHTKHFTAAHDMTSRASRFTRERILTACCYSTRFKLTRILA